MNRIQYILLVLFLIAGCKSESTSVKRIPIARAGKAILYYDEIPAQISDLVTKADSSVIIQNYINKWAKKTLMFQKAETNLSAGLKSEIESHLNETREDLVIYEYQRQMMLSKMDTTISEEELESYYATNEKSFILTSNIVKALFIKLPVETPDIYKIKLLSRADNNKNMQELEGLCYQFAEKFDDFNEDWITMDRLVLELNKNIGDQENFLKWNSYYEASDSASVFLVTINDYRLRGSVSPFEYVRDDIKRIIWSNRRIEFIKTLENGIYNEAIKENEFKTY